MKTVVKCIRFAVTQWTGIHPCDEPECAGISQLTGHVPNPIILNFHTDHYINSSKEGKSYLIPNEIIISIKDLSNPKTCRHWEKLWVDDLSQAKEQRHWEELWVEDILRLGWRITLKASVLRPKFDLLSTTASLKPMIIF